MSNQAADPPQQLEPTNPIVYRGELDPHYNYIPAQLSGKTKRKTKRTEPKVKTLPAILDGDFPESNENYTKMLQDETLLLSPSELGFVPSGFWVSSTVTFCDTVHNFFQKKNNSNCRFPHKLYNALQLVEKKPEMYPYVGVKWLSDVVFKVDKYIFGRLLGITSFDGGLFHSQGNFPSHGFHEIVGDAIQNFYSNLNLEGVDFDRVRIITHSNGFAKDVDENLINQLKWNSNETKVV
ncbi:hypothetical protein GPJ56_010779 [Histomonas meleagridis]|uniref:uncharacterized protein n=1 Tax=Histomonas meleagridis TaxID=135588 RepID=UPI00355A286D|nr:hypothetical protein GPJ56_010779 [Histomonas meleagridis]KAH0801116.1 hypothetical protein GO595_006151 [Histomonas meleagridis]